MRLKQYLLIVIFLRMAMLSSAALAAPDAFINMPKFDSLAAKASDSISITLDEQLLKVAANFLSSSDPADAQAKKLLQGLRGIYVKSYTFADAFVYPKEAIDALRKQLAAPGWNQLMDVRSSKDQANIGIYISLNSANEANGLVIIATEPREFTIVNIVGAIDLAQLKELEGKFGIPQLKLQKKTTAK